MQNMQKPMVSVIIPSYNHEKYIARAIQSVLDQTYTDFELIISDDASQDGSADVIRSFSDERITAFYQEQNLGAVGTIDFLNKQAKGKYIALLNSDDYWAVDKLKKQVEYMESHPEIGICFTQGVIVDENETVLTEFDFAHAYVFMQKNKTQAEWLRYFWNFGNALSHMSILARHDVYAKEFSINPALRQVPDFDLWIRIVQKYPIYVIPESLFYHRRLTKENANTSSETYDNSIRGIVEESWVIGRMIKNMPDELFKEAFSDLFCNKEAQSSVQLQCERFFLLQNHRLGAYLKAVAQTYFLSCALNEEFVTCMKNEYNYTLNKFYAFTGKALLFTEDECVPKKDVIELENNEIYIQCRKDLDEHRKMLEECRKDLDEHRAVLQGISTSACWRITKPIRVVLNILKGKK